MHLWCRFILSGLAVALVPLTSIPLYAGPIFNYIPGAGVSVGDQIYNDFVTAGNYWSSIFSDNVTVNVQISYQPLGPGILGSTDADFVSMPYSTARAALAGDAKTSADATAVAHLQAGPALSFAVNHTSQCGNCSTPYLDNNGDYDNLQISMTRAEAKAAGVLGPATALDGSIIFSSTFAFDFDPTDGITAGKYDFVGVAAHEIGHLLGFVSGVDDYDFCAAATYNCNGAASESTTDATALDLFRYSNPFGTGNLMDMSADNRNKYFSIDGGATLGPLFSNGTSFGDGRQASHWKDNLGIGIMDPTVASGELMAITQNDIIALDVIGWDPVPEPSTAAFALVGIAAIIVLRRSGSRLAVQ